MSARRSGTTAMNVRGVRHPRQVASVPPASEVVTLASAQLADAPLVQLILDDTSGTTAVDTSGNGRNGTYSGTYTLGAAAIAPADTSLSTSFGGGKVTVADAAWMDVDSWTVEAVIYPTLLTSYRAWVCRDDGTSDRQWVAMLKNGPPYDLGWNNSAATTVNSAASAYVVNTPYIVDLRWDSATNKLDTIRNGTVIVSNTTTGTAQLGAQPITIAQNAAGSFVFNGRISHVAFYGTALSDARILAHAEAAGLA